MVTFGRCPISDNLLFANRKDVARESEKDLRSGVVVGGVLLMVIGLVLVSFLGLTWTSSGNGSSGNAGFFSPQIIGLGLIGLGFLTFIAGLAASPANKEVRHIVRKTPQVSEKQPTAPATLLAICPQCKARISPEVKFCPECGADLRPQKT
jgi:ribosomal protein L40E